MKAIATSLLVLAVLALSNTARGADTSAQYEIDSTWIAGGDNLVEMQRTADWYKSVFGMLEVHRYWGGTDRGLGIALNFGVSLAEAKAATGPALGIAKSFPGVPGAPGKENFARIAFNVTHLDLVLKRTTDNGGSIESRPARQGAATVAVVRDPVGNLVELTAAAAASERTPSRPNVTWRAIRIAALDPVKSTQFYRATFDLTDAQQGMTVKIGASPNAVPLEIASVKVMPRPSTSASASPLAVRFKDTAALNGALRRAFDAGGRFMTEPHFGSEHKRTFTRAIDPSGNFVELSGVCKAADVGSAAGAFICG